MVVEELMKEQHKGVMRRLKAGEFDDRISCGKKITEADDTATGESLGSNFDSDIPLQPRTGNSGVSVQCSSGT